MTKTLPHNWQVKKLGEVVQPQYGYTASAQDSGTYRLVRITDINDDGNLKQTDKKYISASLKEINNYLLKKNDLVVARIGSIGRMLYFDSDEPSVFASYLIRLKPDTSQIIPKYLWTFCQTPNYWNQVGTSAGGAVQPQFNANRIKILKIPLPPLPIQRAIVERLDAIRNAQELTNKQITLADELFQSLLAQELKPTPSHRLHRLGDIINPQYGYTEEAKDTGKYRFIRITDIDDKGELINSDKKYIDCGYETVKPYILKNEDLLVARTGATYGKILCWEEDEPSIFASYLIRLNPDKSVVLPKYLWAFSRSNDYWRQAKILVTGAGQPQFNANKIKLLKIPVPSLSVQQAIVEKLQSVQDYKTKLMDEKTKLAELFDSALSRAMSGELIK